MITKAPLTFLSIDNEGTHIMCSCLVNGLKANLLIDTGASRTVFDLARIKEHYQVEADIKKNHKFFSGIGASNIDTFIATIHNIELGAWKIKSLEVVLFDLKAINQSYAMFDLPRIDGVMGGDVLKAANAVINYKEKCLLLEYYSFFY